MEKLLQKLLDSDISIDVVDNSLDISAPKGAMTEDLLDEIKRHKQALIQLITSRENGSDTVSFSKIEMAPLNENYALSSAQNSLWFLSEKEESSSAYNMSSTYKLSGDLDLSALKETFVFLIERHEVLRTNFIINNEGTVRQKILSPLDRDFKLNFVDLSTSSPDEKIILEHIQNFNSTAFKLESDALLQVLLLKTDENQYVFNLKMHHIISDGWSMRVLHEEFFRVYDALSEGDEIPLSLLAINYKDYALWQQNQVESDVFKREEAFWLEQFSEALPSPVVLGYRNVVKKHKSLSDHITTRYSSKVCSDFRKICEENGSTLFMGILALVNVIVFKYSSRNDIIVGTPVSGRSHPDLTNQIGFYVNLLGLRNNVSAEDSFTELLLKIKENTLAAFNHQNYPFDYVLENSALKGNTLFNTLVTFENKDEQPRKKQQFKNLLIEELDVKETNASKFDLEFVFKETNEAFDLVLKYDTGVYEQEFIMQFSQHIESLLQQIAANGNVLIGSIDLLSEDDRNKVLTKFNRNTSPYPENKTFIELFREQVEKTPNAIAVFSKEMQITYAELDELSNKVAYYLTKEQHVEKEDIVAVKLNRSGHLIAAMLGVFKSGGTYLPIDPTYPQKRIDYIENNSQYKVIIDASLMTSISEGVVSEISEVKNLPNDLAYVIYTSGSTGKPKGVLVEHHSIVNLCFWHNQYYNVDSTSRATLFSGTAFDASIWEIMPYLLCGASLYPVADNDLRVNTSQLALFLRENKISHSYLPTRICEEFVSTNEFIKGITILTGGEALKLTKKTELIIYNNYGPTENTVVTTACKVSKDPKTPIPIGKPISNTRVYILNEALEPVAIGISGKLFVGGAGLSRGYLNQPELTARKFIADPFMKGDKIYDTGDLAMWLPAGDVVFMGREDNQVQLRGFRIELGEIESTLMLHDHIEKAFVSVKKINNEDAIIVHILPNENVDKGDLRAFLLNYLPVYMIPSCFIEIQSVPLTANGKVDIERMPAPSDEDFIVSSTLIEPKTSLEKRLAEIWVGVLGVKKIGTRTTIFEVGGSSISIAKIITKIKIQTGYDLKFKDLYENPTIEGIIPLLKMEASEMIPLAPIDIDYPLTSAQFRFWLLCQMPGVSQAYHIPFTLQLKGPLKVNRLQKAFNLLVERHESLRTRFVENVNGEIRQDIATLDSFDFDINLVKVEKNASVNTLISDFEQLPFNLETGPLFRAQLIKRSDEEFLLTLVIHHIIFDGRSLEILIKDLSILYNHVLYSENERPEPLRIQFKDYSSWITNELTQNQDKEKEFWSNELSGDLPILNLSTFQKRPLTQTYQGSSISYTLQDTIFEKVTQFSAQEKKSQFVVLMAALNGLLYRYTGHSDIIVGTPLLGRDHIELENQVGLFINTLPVRTRFDKDDTFSKLVDKQKNTLLNVFEHANYSFGDIINQLNVPRDLSRSPIFDILVIYQNQNNIDFNIDESFDDLVCGPYPGSESVNSKYDLTIAFHDYNGQITINVEFNTNLFKKRFIETFVANFESFLQKAMDHSEQKLKQIEYVTGNQVYQLLAEFNQTEGCNNTDKTVLGYFEEQVEKWPEKVALICNNSEMTYVQLDTRSTQLARYIKDMDLAEHTIIGICLGRSIEMVIAILAIFKSGMSYLPLDPFYPTSRLDYILTDSQTSLVIADTHSKMMLSEAVEVIDLDDEAVWKKTKSVALNTPSINSTAYVIYTSGSTGRPKGVSVSHSNLVNFMEGMNTVFESPHQDEVWLAMTSISFDISILELLWTLSRGSKVVIHLERPLPIVAKPKMNFSLFYFPTHDTSKTASINKYQLLIEGAKFADKNGFEAIWVPERHFHDFGDQFPNPSVAAAAVSTITNRIKLRSGSVVLPLHDPIRVAEEWSMVDNLSNGRVELSIASGWHPNDFVLFPDAYENRHQIMREGIELLQNVWKGNPVTRKNGIGKDFEFFVHPKPIQEELNIWVTAAGSIDTFKYAGSIGANILTHLLGQTLEELDEKIKVYRQTLQENGFKPESRKVALMLHTFINTDATYVRETVEEPFKNYLRNSINLLRPMADELGLDLDNDIEPLLELGFQRFYKTSSLFGTPESCLNVVNEVYKINVDEIAFLIDFGVEEHIVIDNLKNLYTLKDLVSRSRNQFNFIVDRLNMLSDSETTSELIRKHSITHMQATPSFYSEFLMTEDGKSALSLLDTVLVGGEELKVDLADILMDSVKGKVYNMYGPTETTIWSSVKKIKRKQPVTIGKPIRNTKMYVLDELHQLCPVGVPGELYIGGDGVSMGYLKNRALTQSRFIANPFDSTINIYKTGDLAVWDFNGELVYKGRMDTQLKINGYRVDFSEIENVIKEHDLISDAIVSSYHIDGQTLLVAYVIATAPIEDVSIQQLVRLRLPHYMHPSHYTTLDSFPKTPNGKTDVAKLPLPNTETTQTRKVVLPRNEKEDALFQIFKEFLKVNALSIDDNFFEIGGNSIKAFQLLAILNKELQANLKIIAFFQYPTIRSLAEYLEKQTATKVPEIEENDLEDVDDLINFMNDI